MRAAVTRKPKGVQLKPLECLALDNIVPQRDGIKRYIPTSIDPKTRIAFAYAPAHRKQCAASKAALSH